VAASCRGALIRASRAGSCYSLAQRFQGACAALEDDATTIAGKTGLLSKLSPTDGSGCQNVAPDIIAQEELGDWNDPQTVIRAAQV